MDFEILEKLLPHGFCSYAPMGFCDSPWNFALNGKIPHGKKYAVGPVTESCMDTSDPLFSSSGLDISSSGSTNESSNDSFNLNNYNPSAPDLNASTGWTGKRSLSVPRENYEIFKAS